MTAQGVREDPEKEGRSNWPRAKTQGRLCQAVPTGSCWKSRLISFGIETGAVRGWSQRMGNGVQEGSGGVRNDSAILTKFVTTVWIHDLLRDIRKAAYKAPDRSIYLSTPEGKWQGVKQY